MKNFVTTLFVLIILPTIGVLFSFLPVLLGGPKSSFFTFEPDAVYVSNAMVYRDSGNIYYLDHPATPSIVLISKTFLPLTKFLSIQTSSGFINWTIANQGLFYLYIRFFYALLFGLSLGIFLCVIKKFTGSSLITIFSFLSLFIYKHFPYLGVSIASETLSFLILSIWFVFLFLYLKNTKPVFLFLLAFLAGLSIANKFTNLAYAFIPPILAIITSGIISGFFLSLILGAITIFGFIYGIWPIHNNYNSLISWAIKLAVRSGPHGDGIVDPINLSTHIESIRNLWQTEPAAIIFVLLVFLSLIFINFKGKFKNRLDLSLLAIGSLVLIFSLAFTKYGLSRYQQTNYLMFVFIGSFLLSKVNAFPKLVFVSLIFFAAINSLISYPKKISLAINEASYLEDFVSQHPSQKATLWEYGDSIDYSLLTSQEWYGLPYSNELKKIKPNLYAITSDLKYVKASPSKTIGIFNFCWDQLYIQKEVLPQFLNLFNNHHFKEIPIPNTSLRPMVLIESSHCL